jgi:hypothetical protein
MKNAVFWDIKIQFVLHRRHITSPLQSPFGEVCKAVIMKNAVVWNIMPCDSFKNRRFRGTYRLHHQGNKIRRGRNDSSN